MTERSEIKSADGSCSVIFGMPEDEYHAIEALGGTDLRNILIWPLTYWSKSRMNPDREDEESDAKEFGKAYHKLVHEGDEAFHATYAAELDPKDYPKHLRTGEQLKERCEELKLSKSGTLAEMSKRIRTVDKSALLWNQLIEEHEAKHPQRIFLKKKDMRRLALCHRALLASPAAGLIQGGMSEVSIFWPDRLTGVRCKARIDKLHPGKIVESKTFANINEKPLLQAVAAAITTRKYSIPARHYIEGLETVIAAIGDPRLGNPNDPVQYSYVFQESGAAPNVVVKRFRQFNKTGGVNAYWTKADLEIRHALETHARCMKKYGREPWVESPPASDLEDHDLPGYHFTS